MFAKLKKYFFIPVILIVFVGGGYFFVKSPEQPSLTEVPCAFCNATILANQKFYEDELVLALISHRPIFPGHCLIIPKRHAERFEMLTNEEMTQIGLVIKKVHQAAMQEYQSASYLLLQKNGREAGQTVPHVHFHYIPKQAHDASVLVFFIKMYWSQIKKPLSNFQMQTQCKKMQAAMHTDCADETL
ncbi:MAG: HIT family protein [Verrucomicrobia bacterium]|nr:HIT family protein [Verrucomicrobiota bacterium]MBS0647496.1 HIT family protein [Verrucomicrobiota bacterium]